MADKQYAPWLFRRVSDNWLRDGEYWAPVNMSKLPPGFIFTKGMQYRDCIDASNMGGGMSNPLPDLALPFPGPSWWQPAGVPWTGYVLVDIKEGNEYQQWAVFAPNVQATASLKPSVQYETEDDWLWPAVLKGKGLLPIQIYAITNSNLVSVNPNVYLQPETRAKSRVIVRQWWSTNDWSKRLTLKPDVYASAKEVTIGYPGYRRTIRCLHDRVTTPAYRTADIEQITYPATAYTTWASDTKNKIEEIGGRYFREEREYFPPFDPLDRRTVPFISGS